MCERRVDLLVCSLPLHRHSYIGFILAFASSIHNKQPFDSARGTGEGGRKRGIASAGRVWQQQGGYGLVGHVPRYRMIHFGGYLTQVEGAGGDTVKNLSS